LYRPSKLLDEWRRRALDFDTCIGEIELKMRFREAYHISEWKLEGIQSGY
jgi:hypothetical protein